MNTGGVHGSALGDDEVAATKRVPDSTRTRLSRYPTRSSNTPASSSTGAAKPTRSGRANSTPGRSANPSAKRFSTGSSPTNCPMDGMQISHWEPGSKAVATRAASGAVLAAVGPKLPELWGGSADLAGSNNTTTKGANSFGPPSISTEDWNATWYGRTLHFGIREHAMGSILSGIVLHGPDPAPTAEPSCSSPITCGPRCLAALADIDTIYVWTHDSIGLGEDGPTHQPIEHLAALRAIPKLSVVRPGDPE